MRRRRCRPRRRASTPATPLPAGADAVAALDAVQMRGAQAEALAAVAPGEGVLAPDADAAAGLQLRLAGARLRRIDVALLTALGVERVLVRAAARARGARRRRRRSFAAPPR